MSLKQKTLLLILILFLSLSPLWAGTRSFGVGDDLSVSLMVIGPGMPLYVWWGHIGLIVENKKMNWSYFYDFGNFSFEADHFYRNFAMGRLYYLKVRSRTEPYLRYLTWFNRKVAIYDLNLTAGEKQAVYEELEEGIKPENRTYLYHHYEDNCSTRIRDTLDHAMNGELHDACGDYALTFRDQSNRFIRSFWPYLLLNYLQGPSVDKKIGQWEALFLPRELEKMVQTHIRPDGTPLVKKTNIYQEGLTPYIPEIPFPWWGAAFLWGMLLFFITLGFRVIPYGKLTALWRVFSVLLTALPGVFLCFMMFFTDHDVTHWNLNALITCPVLLGALVPALRCGKSADAPRNYERFWNMQAFLALFSLLFKLLPGVVQDNGAVLFFYLPLILAHGSAGTALVRVLIPTLKIYPWSRK